MDLQPVNQFEVTGEHEILASYEAIREVVNGITIDSASVATVEAKKTIQKGMPLGKLANGKYGAYGVTTLSANAALGATSITVVDGTRFIVGDLVKVGGEAATIAITAIVGNVLTLATGLIAARTAADIVQVQNGRELPSVILKRDVDVTNGDAVVGGYEMAKVIAERIPVTVDATLIGKMPFIQFA